METKLVKQRTAAQQLQLKAGARLMVAGVHGLMMLMGGAAAFVVTIRGAYRRIISGSQSLKEQCLQAVTGKPPEIPVGLSEEYQTLCLKARGYVDRIHRALESANASNRAIRKDLHNVRRSTLKNLRGAYRLAQRCQRIETRLKKSSIEDLARDITQLQTQIALFADSATQEIGQRALYAMEEHKSSHEELIAYLPQLRDALKQCVKELKEAAETLEDICNRSRGPRGGKRMPIIRRNPPPPKLRLDARPLPC